MLLLPDPRQYAARKIEQALAGGDPDTINQRVLQLIQEHHATVICCTSGGKDSMAMLHRLRNWLPPEQLIVQYQLLLLQWTMYDLPYLTEQCKRLGLPLLAQQIIYEPDPARGPTSVRRREIRTINSPADIVPWGTGTALADITDLAAHRGMPPSPHIRWCTQRSKASVTNVTAHQIADTTDLAIHRGMPPSPKIRFCTAFSKRALTDAHVATQDPPTGSWIIVALGERGRESPSRAADPMLAFRGKPKRSYTYLNWLPVHHLRRIDIFQELQDAGIAPHLAYARQGMTQAEMQADDEGGQRCSCIGCIYAREDQVILQATLPECRPAFERLAQVEQLTGKTWWAPPRLSATELLAWATTGAPLRRPPRNKPQQLRMFPVTA